MKLYAFKWVPEFAQGLVKDLRVRWACEEAGIPLEIKLITFENSKAAEYRMLQPFGQVPALVDEDLVLFESGSILIHLGKKSPSIMPADKIGQARATTWVFAALNSVEPYTASEFYPEVSKAKLADLSQWLGNKEFLESQFTIGDIAMTTVLREADRRKILDPYPVLLKYLRRCEARAPFKKALEAQLKTFAENTPPAN